MEIEEYTNLHSGETKIYGHTKRTAPNSWVYENRSKAKTGTMKWVPAVKADLDNAGIPQTAGLTDRKHSKRKVYAGNVMVRGKSAKRPDKFGLMSGKEPFQRE